MCHHQVDETWYRHMLWMMSSPLHWFTRNQNIGKNGHPCGTQEVQHWLLCIRHPNKRLDHVWPFLSTQNCSLFSSYKTLIMLLKCILLALIPFVWI